MLLPDGRFRQRPDSSTLPAPRLLARRFVRPDDLDDQIASHERAPGARCDSRTGIPDTGLELAAVANLLLIGSPSPPSEVARTTAFTLLVASVVDYVAGLEAAGTELTEPISTEPSGSRTRVRYPDGTLVEVIDSRPLPDEI